ncbi:MAG: ABC transporter ATP-binding protein [Xanthomonadaceae bacterium]|nr:ABC transporter ATP-binding protein [Xanthomonadaceae bacterium]
MIRLEGIHRDFQVGDQTVHALDDVALTVEQGEYLSVMGPSGSGKSTLLNIIGLLDRPSAGAYFLNDKNVTELSEEQQAQVRNRNIGFVFQAFHLIPRLTAAENIELPLLLAGLPPAERRTRVKAALETLKLSDRAHHKPEQLSGGQRQRVAIARATITEPMASLEALHEKGITLIVVTHDPALGDRAVRHIKMVDGRVDRDQQPARDHAHD